MDWLINQIRSDEPTEAMLKGTAFHKFLEHARTGGEFIQADQDGYTFVFTGDFDLYLPPMREQRRNKDYGGIIVSGQADAVLGRTIWDHKTTERFDAEKYLESWQHRYYLDLFDADKFVWNIWEMKEIDDGPEYCPDDGEQPSPPVQIKAAYEVYALHQLEQYRYAGMEQDCRDLALEYAEFAAKHLPQMERKS